MGGTPCGLYHRVKGCLLKGRAFISVDKPITQSQAAFLYRCSPSRVRPASPGWWQPNRWSEIGWQNSLASLCLSIRKPIWDGNFTGITILFLKTSGGSKDLELKGSQYLWGQEWIHRRPLYDGRLTSGFGYGSVMYSGETASFLKNKTKETNPNKTKSLKIKSKVFGVSELSTAQQKWISTCIPEWTTTWKLRT